MLRRLTCSGGTFAASTRSAGCGLQVSQWDVAADILEDYDAGLEYCEAERILKGVQRGDEREYLVRCAPPWRGCRVCEQRTKWSTSVSSAVHGSCEHAQYVHYWPLARAGACLCRLQCSHWSQHVRQGLAQFPWPAWTVSSTSRSLDPGGGHLLLRGLSCLLLQVGR